MRKPTIEQAAKAYAAQEVYKAMIKNHVLIHLCTLGEITLAVDAAFNMRPKFYRDKGRALTKAWRKEK